MSLHNLYGNTSRKSGSVAHPLFWKITSKRPTSFLSLRCNPGMSDAASITKPNREVTKSEDGNYICTLPDCNDLVRKFQRKCEWRQVDFMASCTARHQFLVVC